MRALGYPALLLLAAALAVLGVVAAVIRVGQGEYAYALSNGLVPLLLAVGCFAGARKLGKPEQGAHEG